MGTLVACQGCHEGRGVESDDDSGSADLPAGVAADCVFTWKESVGALPCVIADAHIVNSLDCHL